MLPRSARANRPARARALRRGDNLLAVIVDSRCLPVPPVGVGRGPASIDFFQPGGIYRDVRLRVLPQAFLSDLFALPADVLSPQRRVDVECTIDSAMPTHTDGTLLVELLKLPSPLYTAAMLCVPTLSVLVVNVATPPVTRPSSMAGGHEVWIIAMPRRRARVTRAAIAAAARMRTPAA